MRRPTLILAVLLLFMLSISLFAQPGNFNTSLHKTRVGKNYWYGADTSVTGAPKPGFEAMVNVSIDSLGCVLCHPGDNLNANGDPYPTPYPGADCVDCHATNSGTPGPVTQDDCYGCHGRQKTERVKLGYTDVHTDSLVCWDCHGTEDMHGDGTTYSSMLEPGAIDADCSNSGCHETLPPNHSNYDPHGGSLHCNACHAQTVISCYNCHFESQVQFHVKRAKQPIHDFVILVNREKDGKIGTATFQSLTYQGHAFAAFAPFHSHTITDSGRQCNDCHVNFGGTNTAIDQYNSTGEIQFATWNDVDSTLSWIHGVVPMPADYKGSFKMNFITFEGDPSSPPGPSKNWSYIGKNTWDGHQMFFATPLNKVQMAKIGFDTTLTGIDNNEMGEIPGSFELKQNYPNPFNPNTVIEFRIPKSTKITIDVFDILGSKIRTLVDNREMSAGNHRVAFRANDLASGIYFYRLTSTDFSQTRKMFLLR